MRRRETSREHESGRVQETKTNAQFHHPQENAEFPKTPEIGKRRPTPAGGNPRVLGQKARTAEQRKEGGRQVVENFLHR